MTAVEDDLVAALKPDTIPDDPDDGTANEALADWNVANIDEANWAARKLARLTRRRAEITASADRQRAAIDEWEARVARKLDADLTFYGGRLEVFHRLVLADDPKAKTVPLVEVTLTSTAGRVSVQVTDEAAAVAWAETNEHADIVTYPEPKIDKKEVAKEFGQKVSAEAGEYPVVDPDSGEVAPGIAFVRGERNFTAQVADEVRDDA